MPTPAPPIAVTGSTGRLGGLVARKLAASGIAQRLLVRDPARAPELPSAVAVRASYDDGSAVEEALAGIETVLMVSASETPERVEQHRSFIDAAAAAGVANLVYTSFCGAAPDATFTLARDHWATEQHILGTRLRATFLRDNLYADFLPLLVDDQGAIRGPAGDGRVAAVVQDDIADAAVAVLRDPGRHAGRTYELTGPEALTLTEVAATLTTVTGRARLLRPGDGRGGLRVPRDVRRPRLAARCLGLHVHRHRRRLPRGRHHLDRGPHRAAGHVARAAAPARLSRPVAILAVSAARRSARCGSERACRAGDRPRSRRTWRASAPPAA